MAFGITTAVQLHVLPIVLFSSYFKVVECAASPWPAGVLRVLMGAPFWLPQLVFLRGIHLIVLHPGKYKQQTWMDVPI